MFAMSRWRISRGQAVDLQEWALEESGTKEFLKDLPELPKDGVAKPGLYVSYEIDESELDGGIDWPDVDVATVIGVFRNGREKVIGGVRAYNWEAIWLSTADIDEIDDPREWWRSIQDVYERLERRDRRSKKGSFTGMWYIYEMETWDKDYFNMEVRAYIKIGAGNSGDFQFGLVRGEMDGRVVDYADGERFEFTWEGNDECDPACGSGWVKLKGKDLLEGEFRIHNGESSTFLARKAKRKTVKSSRRKR